LEQKGLTMDIEKWNAQNKEMDDLVAVIKHRALDAMWYWACHRLFKLALEGECPTSAPGQAIFALLYGHEYAISPESSQCAENVVFFGEETSTSDAGTPDRG
jgi:hypothetical protein